MVSRKARITTATLRSLQPEAIEWFVRDTAQRGFQIKVSPSGTAVYQVEARLGGTGKIKKFKLANVQDIKLPEARERAKEALDKIRSGIDPLQEKRAQMHGGKTLRQLIEIYYQTRDLKPRTREGYEYMANRQFRNWLDRRVADITKHEIRDWYVRGRKTKTHTEGAYRFLNSLMTFAMGLEIITENPCQLITNAGMRYLIKKRTTHIEINEDLGKFLQVLIEYPYLRDSERVARDLILLILTTGLRSIEARTLKWSMVDFDRKLFIVPKTKNGRDHIVPLTPLTYALLRYRYENREGSDYVFRVKGETKSGYMTHCQKTLTNICNAAGIPVVTPHDLRRTFASVLNSLNVGFADLKQLMNHTTQDVTANVYIQPDMRNLRGILIRLVSFYDHKIPFFERRQGVSQYADGVLKYAVYRHGEPPTPTELDNPTTEDPEWIEQADREFWEG